MLVAAWIVLGGFVDLAPGSPAKAAGNKRIARVEGNLLRCTNVRREKHGLKRLRVGRALKRAARSHARNMARQGFFDHTDPAGRGPSERVALFKPREHFKAIGENIAAGQPSATAACRAWMDSSGHRANLLGPYNRIGLGFWPGGTYGRYYVQVFARAR